MIRKSSHLLIVVHKLFYSFIVDTFRDPNDQKLILVFVYFDLNQSAPFCPKCYCSISTVGHYLQVVKAFHTELLNILKKNTGKSEFKIIYANLRLCQKVHTQMHKHSSTLLSGGPYFCLSVLFRLNEWEKLFTLKEIPSVLK